VLAAKKRHIEIIIVKNILNALPPLISFS